MNRDFFACKKLSLKGSNYCQQERLKLQHRGLCWAGGHGEEWAGGTLLSLMLSPVGAARGAGSPLCWVDGFPGKTVMGQARATGDSRKHIFLRVTSSWSQPSGQCASVRTPQ